MTALWAIVHRADVATDLAFTRVLPGARFSRSCPTRRVTRFTATGGWRPTAVRVQFPVHDSLVLESGINSRVYYSASMRAIRRPKLFVRPCLGNRPSPVPSCTLEIGIGCVNEVFRCHRMCRMGPGYMVLRCASSDCRFLFSLTSFFMPSSLSPFNSIFSPTSVGIRHPLYVHHEKTKRT